MPRHEPSNKPDPGELLKGRVRMRRDAQGKLQVVTPEQERHTTTEAKPRPPQADDPRGNAERNIGPGGGFV